MSAPADASIYYHSGYWNELPEVLRHIQRRVTGDEGLDVWAWFQRQHHGKTFERALILNAGNGWVERDLIDRGIIASAVGLEYLPDLVAAARHDAGDRDLRYEQCDINVGALPDGPFDVVVNNAACHHIARLDRVLRAVATLLPDDGVFVSNDYIGPHRNQYPYDMWSRVSALNAKLPERFRKELTYPHLPTMLATDPTEAIHSELILDVVRRYFDLVELRPIGGALAYEVLTFNDGIHQASEADRADAVRTVLEHDEAYTDAPDGGPLFAFFYGSPRRDVLADQSQLDAWSREEGEREAGAAAAGGEYYDRTLLQNLTNDLSEARVAAEHRLVELHRAMSDPSVRQLARALAKRVRQRVSRR